MVVGVSCSVVGPKRYERWGVTVCRKINYLTLDLALECLKTEALRSVFTNSRYLNGGLINFC